MKLRKALFALVILVAAGAPPGAAQESPEEAAARAGFSIDPDEPMRIQAEELDAVRDAGSGERVVFRRGVRAVQGDLDLRCDWLEALYPAGGGGTPVRITARGSVHGVQADTEIRCGEMVYDRAACRVTCTGESPPALIRRGEDLMRGREIIWDLCKGLLKVRGGATVEARPRSGEGAPGTEGSE